ncbi:MAG TPA: SiaB family protein kinase [Alphaproteobacteria bacterium]|nr:SiaB family protein kinase [Alphaproteobacteria bacterium]
MSEFDLFDLQTQLSRQNLLICFSGPFRHSIIEELGLAVKRYLEQDNVTKSALLDVFSVYVEQAQNVRNYTMRREADQSLPEGSGIVVIGREEEGYVVSSGNLVLAEDVAPLVAHLDRLSGLDKAALKALYKEQARRPREDAAGAGLGLIDMARRATRPLRYAVRPVGDRTTFFSLAVHV